MSCGLRLLTGEVEWKLKGDKSFADGDKKHGKFADEDKKHQKWKRNPQWATKIQLTTAASD